MKFEELYQLIMENSAPRQYSCLMLDLSFLSNEIKKIQEKICPCDVYDLEPGHGLENEFHITCKFGLHEQNAHNIFKELELKPIKFKLTKISLFENEKYDVIKFDVSSKELKALNAEVCKKFDYTDRFPTYHPHSTICYAMPGSGHKYTKIVTDLIGKEFTSNRYIFSNANGDKVFVTAV